MTRYKSNSSGGSKGLLMAALVLSAVGLSAETPSFWGEGSPVTNRVPPVAVAQALPFFSSDVCFLADFVLSPFYSTSAGFKLFVY